ncbi:MAG: DUF1003 domain-containing protein [Chthonomonadetes bacterium]|nr:DUF1003 domain-containing protein [Chthonomonadetes bacterium]
MSVSEGSEVPMPLHEVKRRRKPVRNVNVQHHQQLTPMERIALWITQHVGTMGFFLLIAIWSMFWLLWNLMASRPLRFDPPPAFVLWLFLSNLIQILLMPLLLVGQNVLSRHAELRADNDYEVNLKTEQEVEVILQHLEYQDRLLEKLVALVQAQDGRRTDAGT